MLRAPGVQVVPHEPPVSSVESTDHTDVEALPVASQPEVHDVREVACARHGHQAISILRSDFLPLAPIAHGYQRLTSLHVQRELPSHRSRVVKPDVTRKTLRQCVALGTSAASRARKPYPTVLPPTSARAPTTRCFGRTPIAQAKRSAGTAPGRSPYSLSAPLSPDRKSV